MKISFPEFHLFQVLKRFENQHLPLDLFLSHYFRSHKALGSKDRKLIAESVYGMTRWQSLLDHLVGEHPTWEKRYAVFREFQPNNFLFVNHIPAHVRVSFPQDLYEMLVEQYGEEKANHICQISNTEAPLTLRANPLKTTRDKLLPLFEDSTPIGEHGIQLKSRRPLFIMPEFKEGKFEVQDEASQIAAEFMNPEPGNHVLDYCAGAGGKTLAFAHKMENKGQIYLHDIRPYILEQARKRLKRAGIQNAQFLNPDHPHLAHIKKKMDWVLVDAPCSGTGTYRRNPDQKWKFTPEMVQRLIGEQRKIFERALSFLKPGGHIVYATCSVLKQENEEQLHHFIQTYDLKLVGDVFQTFPVFGGMDGFFTAVLARN